MGPLCGLSLRGSSGCPAPKWNGNGDVMWCAHHVTCVSRISCSRCYRYCWRLSCWSVKASVRRISRPFYPMLPSSRFLLLIKSKRILQKESTLLVSCCAKCYNTLDTVSINLCKFPASNVDAGSCKCSYKIVQDWAMFCPVQESCTNKNMRKKTCLDLQISWACGVIL